MEGILLNKKTYETPEVRIQFQGHEPVSMWAAGSVIMLLQK